MIKEHCPEVLHYLPDPHGKNEILPEREFFWQVVYALKPEQCEQFILEVEQQRRQKGNLQDQKKKLDISDDFLNDLLRYDFVSTKKGRGHSSLLINRKANQ